MSWQSTGPLGRSYQTKGNMNMKSFLRYPGGKSRRQARSQILACAPDSYEEFREPFVGGAGIGLSIASSLTRWFNDINPDLMAVYEALRDSPEEFIDMCRQIQPLSDHAYADPSDYEVESWGLERTYLRMLEDKSVPSAVRFYFRNRTSFSGVVVDGHRCFSTPERWEIVNTDILAQASAILQGVKLTSVDFAARKQCLDLSRPTVCFGHVS